MAVRILVREAFRSFGRSKRLNLISLGAMSMALMALGLVGLLNIGLYSVTGFVEDKIDLVAFLDRDIEEIEVQVLLRKIRDYPQVLSADYISRESALKEFAGDPALETFMAVLGENPLPASLRIQLREKTPETVSRFAEWLRALPGIAEAGYGVDDAARLLRGLQVVRMAVILLTAGLAAAAVIIIGNIISLMVFSRKDEIGIMQMIGATPGFIRGPFILWGMIQGAVGGALAGGLLFGLWSLLNHYARTEVSINLAALLPRPAWELGLAGAGLLMAVGMTLGLLGSLVSVRGQLVE